MPAFAAALRRLRQSPLFTLFSITTLALGMGVTTAVYSAVYALFGRPMGISEPDRAVFITRSSAPNPDASTPVSWADYSDFTARQRGFSAVAAISSFGSGLSTPSGNQLVSVEAVTGQFFAVAGVRIPLGRPIQPGDDRPDAPMVMVLSDATWRAQFGADPAVISRRVRIANQSVEIVGIAPAGFRGARSLFVTGVAGWTSMATAWRLEPALAPNPLRRSSGSCTVVARLKPDSTLQTAGTDISTIAAQLDTEAPLQPLVSTPDAASVPVRRAWGATPLDVSWASIGSAEAMRLFLALPTLVLLVACTNLGNLVLSRGVTRRHEFAVRAALGASRARLVREELLEATVLAVVGGALGLGAARALLNWAVLQLREPLSILAPELLLDWRLEPAVLTAAALTVLLTLIVAGLIPALQLTRSNPRATLATDSAAALPRWRGRSNLIALQVGVSAGLFLIAIVSFRFVVKPPAFRTVANLDLSGVAVASVPFGRQQYDESRARAMIEAVLADGELTRDVDALAATTSFPTPLPGFSAWSPDHSVLLAGQPCDTRRNVTRLNETEEVVVSPRFFEAVRVPVRFGRAFTPEDRADGAPVLVVNTAVAQTVFGQANPTGRSVVLCPDPRRTPGPARTVTIVGVVDDGALLTRSSRPSPRVYSPLSQRYEPTVIFVARGPEDAHTTTGRLNAAIRRADPDVAVRASGPADALAAGPFAFLRFFRTMAFAMAALTLVLAMAGLYGVLTHVVDRRRREMGVRVALGATQARLVRLVLKDGVRPVLEGSFIGLAVALVIRQWMQVGVTERMSPIDVATFLAAAVPLLVAGAIAAYLPARRAARVDPIAALKDL